MNFSIKENLKKKSLGYFLGLIASLIGLISLIIFFVYANKNKSTSVACILFLILGIVLQLFLFFTDEKLSDILSVFVPVCYMVSLIEELHTGVGNIVDSIQGIVMFGNSSLVGFNYTLAVLLLIATLLAIAQIFMKKTKEVEA